MRRRVILVLDPSQSILRPGINAIIIKNRDPARISISRTLKAKRYPSVFFHEFGHAWLDENRKAKDLPSSFEESACNFLAHLLYCKYFQELKRCGKNKPCFCYPDFGPPQTKRIKNMVLWFKKKGLKKFKLQLKYKHRPDFFGPYK